MPRMGTGTAGPQPAFTAETVTIPYCLAATEMAPVSEDSPAAQVGVSCSTEGNEAPKNNRQLLHSSPTGNLPPPLFPPASPPLPLPCSSAAGSPVP